VSVAYLNTRPDAVEQNYSMLIHTSGKRVDHRADWYVFDQTVSSLIDRNSTNFSRCAKEIWETAATRHGPDEADGLTTYVLDNVSRYAIFILNSDRDFVQNGLSATNPSALFTVIIGGNIVSRGVTFENLLAMFFTRDVKHRIQQDTYIQRARMFGSRGNYLSEFELTIPDQLYVDWHRCFVFHRLALAAIQRNLGSPVWLTDSRIAAVSASSIDASTVDVNRGEMAFQLFDFDDRYDAIVNSDAGVVQKLEQLSAAYGNSIFPGYLKEFMVQMSPDPDQAIAVHGSSSISGYSSEGIDKARIERRRGFMGNNQLEKARYPNAMHHIKVFSNDQRKARFLYKYEGSIQFVKNTRS
jgi:hypothetical protein